MTALIFECDNKVLNAQTRMIEKLIPQAEVVSFHLASEAAAYAAQHKVDWAFLDASEERELASGMVQKLKNGNPLVQIIYCCGLSSELPEYAQAVIRKPFSESRLSALLSSLTNGAPGQ